MIESAQITITKKLTETDPRIPIYEVSLTVDYGDAGAEWRETFGSDEHLQIFLRGVTCGSSLPALRDATTEYKNYP